MPSKKPYIQIRSDEPTIKKFQHIADEECRSMSSLGEYMIKQYIKTYETEHGEIIVGEEQETI